jgi:hypothetical protein
MQDFRALNANTQSETHSLKEVSVSIWEIGKPEAGFRQLWMHPEVQPYTTFVLPGLMGALASFQCLMEAIMHCLPNMVVHLDKLVFHSA